MKIERAPDTMPDCPKCGRPPYRKGKGIGIKPNDQDFHDDGVFCVCMYCSSIWCLDAGAWRLPTESEMKNIKPLVEIVALKRWRDLLHHTAGNA